MKTKRSQVRPPAWAPFLKKQALRSRFLYIKLSSTQTRRYTSKSSNQARGYYHRHRLRRKFLLIWHHTVVSEIFITNLTLLILQSYALWGLYKRHWSFNPSWCGNVPKLPCYYKKRNQCRGESLGFNGQLWPLGDIQEPNKRLRKPVVIVITIGKHRREATWPILPGWHPCHGQACCRWWAATTCRWTKTSRWRRFRKNRSPAVKVLRLWKTKTKYANSLTSVLLGPSPTTITIAGTFRR